MRSAVPVVSRRAGLSAWFSQALHNRLIALVLAMIVAVPLLAAPADSSLTGIAALTFEGFALLLLTVLVWRAKWDLRRETVLSFLSTGANLPVLLFVAWTALSCAFSPAKVFSIQQLLQVGAGALLYFVVAYQFRQSKHLSMLADVLLYLSLAVALGGLAHYQMNTGERAEALFGDPQPLGSFLMLLLPLVASLAFGDKNSRRQIIAQITFVLMIGCLMLTQGRSAWLGAAAAMAVFAFLSMRLAKREKTTSHPLAARKHQFVLPGMLALIAVGFVLVMNSQNASIGDRVSTVSKLGADVSVQARLTSHWAPTWKMIQERPLTGFGAGLYPVKQHEYTGMGAPLAEGGAGIRGSLAEQAHNYYLQTAAELGLPGLALVLAILGSFGFVSWKRLHQMDEGIRRTLLIASMAATAGFAVDAFSSPSWQYGQNAMFFWLVLGMGVSCLRPRARQQAEEVTFVHVPSRRIAMIARPMAVAGLLMMVTLLPTVVVAQGQGGYNPPASQDDGTDGADVAFGLAALAGIGYVIYGQLTGGFSGVGGAGAGSGGIIPPGDDDATPTPTPLTVTVP